MRNGIEERLTKLERSNRRWKAATVSLLLAVGAALIAGAESAPGPAAILQARRFELIDSQGKAAIVLESHDDANSLVVWGPDHQHAAVLVSKPTKASMLLMKNKDAPEVFAEAAEGGGEVGVSDGAAGAANPQALNLIAGRSGSALVHVVDGRPQSRLGFNSDGAVLELKAPASKALTRLGASAHGGRIELLGVDGKPLWTAPPAPSE